MTLEKPRNPLQAAGDALVVEQARQGKTLQQIGDAFGVTREAVRLRLKSAGYTIKDFPRLACSYCGAPLAGGTPEVRYGLHACRASECRTRYDADRSRLRTAALRNERLGGEARAVCASPDCGRVLPMTAPRGDGRPSFCDAKPCKAARVRWLHRNDPVYQEWNRRSAAARRRGEPVTTVARVRREMGGAPPRSGRATEEDAARARAVLARRGAGVSERTVARAFGISRSQVNAIWTGRRWPSLHGQGAAP